MSKTTFTIHIEQRDETGRVVRAFDGLEETSGHVFEGMALASVLASALRAMTDRRRSPIHTHDAAMDLVSCLANETDEPSLLALSEAWDKWSCWNDFHLCVKVVVDEAKLMDDGDEEKTDAK